MSSPNKPPTSINNIPPQLLLPFLNFQQITALARVSPNFFRWFKSQSPRNIARLVLAYRNHLLSTRKLPGIPGPNRLPLSPGNRKFLEHRANYSRFRGNAFERGVQTVHAKRIVHRHQFDPLIGFTTNSRSLFRMATPSMRKLVPPMTIEFFAPSPMNRNSKTGRVTASAVKVTPNVLKNLKKLSHLGVRNKVLQWSARAKATVAKKIKT